MRVAVDARELAGRPTGVGRYLAEILRGWSAWAGGRGPEVVLCAASDDLPAFPGLTTTALTAPGGGTVWEQWTLPRLVREARPDVLFAPAYTAPLASPVPYVVTIHDVSFAAHPDWFGWREGLRRRMLTRWAGRRAARVITVSEFSKREIVRHLGLDARAIDVIHSGATRLPGLDLQPPADAAAPAPTVLFVGSIFNRRHVPALVEAFGLVAAHHPGVRLEIVGDNRSRPHVPLDDLVRRSPAAGRIRVRAYVTDAELAALYGRASAFAFLSSYEGFGLTPLDALGLGIPVVVLDTEVAREVYGEAAEFVAGPDPALVAAALTRVLFDADLRRARQAAGLAVARRYTWDACARRTLEVLTAAAGTRR